MGMHNGDWVVLSSLIFKIWFEFLTAKNIIFIFLKTLHFELICSQYILHHWTFFNYIQSEKQFVFSIAYIDLEVGIFKFCSLNLCAKLLNLATKV